MAFEDQTLVCQQCGADFVFSAAQQERFAQRGFVHPPKLCKTCYDAKKRTEGGGRGPQRRPRAVDMGEYRSPAFRDSAPDPRGGGRGPGGPRRAGGGQSEYRAPGFRDHAARSPDERGRQGGGYRGGRDEYRSPAFRDNPRQHDDDYRSPAFREQAQRRYDDEYRSPAFREHESRDYQSEYRAPGFQDRQVRHRDEQPLFQLTCVRCGKKEMVPFLPEEKEEPLCQDCYREQRRAQRAAAQPPPAEPSIEATAEPVAPAEAPPEPGEET